MRVFIAAEDMFSVSCWEFSTGYINVPRGDAIMIVSIFPWFNSDTAGNNANFTRFIISLVSQNLCNFNFEVCFLLFMIKRDCVVFPRGHRADPALQWVFFANSNHFPRGLFSDPALHYFFEFFISKYSVSAGSALLPRYVAVFHLDHCCVSNIF